MAPVPRRALRELQPQGKENENAVAPVDLEAEALKRRSRWAADIEFRLTLFEEDEKKCCAEDERLEKLLERVDEREASATAVSFQDEVCWREEADTREESNLQSFQVEDKDSELWPTPPGSPVVQETKLERFEGLERDSETRLRREREVERREPQRESRKKDKKDLSKRDLRSDLKSDLKSPQVSQVKSLVWGESISFSSDLQSPLELPSPARSARSASCTALSRPVVGRGMSYSELHRRRTPRDVHRRGEQWLLQKSYRRRVELEKSRKDEKKEKREGCQGCEGNRLNRACYDRQMRWRKRLEDDRDRERQQLLQQQLQKEVAEREEKRCVSPRAVEEVFQRFHERNQQWQLARALRVTRLAQEAQESRDAQRTRDALKRARSEPGTPRRQRPETSERHEVFGHLQALRQALVHSKKWENAPGWQKALQVEVRRR